MNEVEQAIAGGRFEMLKYLEGKQIYFWQQWHQVKNGRAGGIYLVYHQIETLEGYCREAIECVE